MEPKYRELLSSPLIGQSLATLGCDWSELTSVWAAPVAGHRL